MGVLRHRISIHVLASLCTQTSSECEIHMIKIFWLSFDLTINLVGHIWLLSMLKIICTSFHLNVDVTWFASNDDETVRIEPEGNFSSSLDQKPFPGPWNSLPSTILIVCLLTTDIGTLHYMPLAKKRSFLCNVWSCSFSILPQYSIWTARFSVLWN